MHSRIIEIREGRPFSAQETKNGVMDANDIRERYADWFDYIRPSGCPRQEDIDWFSSRLYEVLVRDNNADDKFILQQDGFDKNIEQHLSELKDFVAQLTPETLFDYEYKLKCLGSMCSSLADFFVYLEEYEDVFPIEKWLLMVSQYHAHNKKTFYVGKIWDYHT